MRLAAITNYAYGVTLFLTLASGITMLLASNSQEQERAAVALRHQLDQASSKIAAEVTRLSDQACDYVITGEDSHLDLYRREAAALQSSEERIQKIKDVGADGDELVAIADAMRIADTLQDKQREAITARQQGQTDLARSILFGADYDRQLDRVAANIERFQYRLDQRTDAEVTSATNLAKTWKTCSEIVLGITGLLSVCVLYFIFKRRVLRPVVSLSDVVTRLAAQDYAVEPPAYHEIDEIGDMAQAIRIFRENGLERQRLEAERNTDLARRSLLSRMTQRMQECESMHHLERVIESFVPEIAPGLAGRLYLLDEEHDLLVETCSWLGPVRSRTEFPPSACWALQRGELHRPKGLAVDVPCDHLDSDRQRIDSICLPLIAQRTTLGLLYLEPCEEPTARLPEVAEIYLKTLSEYIGLAVGNLRLRDRLRAMAMVDPLTGLANRRRLETALEFQLAEANRFSQSIGCIMLDVDHFKHFNDVFGHAAGDVVLRAVADLLKQSTRDNDLAFRYGGEEFLLLMPAMSAAQAAERAEEIRRRIATLHVEHAGRELGPITASFGVAAAPDLCAFSKVVEAADAALLRAKETGRDRVVVAEGGGTRQDSR